MTESRNLSYEEGVPFIPTSPSSFCHSLPYPGPYSQLLQLFTFCQDKGGARVSLLEELFTLRHSGCFENLNLTFLKRASTNPLSHCQALGNERFVWDKKKVYSTGIPDQDRRCGLALNTDKMAGDFKEACNWLHWLSKNVYLALVHNTFFFFGSYNLKSNILHTFNNIWLGSCWSFKENLPNI